MFGIPLEYLMFGGIGFCLAWLMALMALSAVHNRAIRLARQRYDDLPLSMQEIRAEKDTIRAGFAAATRELEIRLEKLREKTVAHATDVAKKNQLIDRLKQEIQTVSGALRESETREQSARDGLREAKRGFVDKDVTLGTAEGQIAVLQRELASKNTSLQAATRDIETARSEASTRDAALRKVERDMAALRSELAERDTALTGAGRELAALRAALSESEARERAAGSALSATRRGVADKDATLGAVESEISALKHELAARDGALVASERDLAVLRGELAAKDAALNRAEREIAAIKAEIAALTPLLLQASRDTGSPRSVEVVPFVAASRPAALSSRGAVQPLPIQPPAPQQQQTIAKLADVAPTPASLQTPPTSHPSERAQTQPQPRAPIDVIPAPTRLIPPAIPRAQEQNDDKVRQAVTEISDAARRVDERHAGINQRLRAIYAPLAKSTT
jgi:predicted  nucleic acid-binding Zn-ribbon protein